MPLAGLNSNYVDSSLHHETCPIISDPLFPTFYYTAIVNLPEIRINEAFRFYSFLLLCMDHQKQLKKKKTFLFIEPLIEKGRSLILRKSTENSEMENISFSMLTIV